MIYYSTDITTIVYLFTTNLYHLSGLVPLLRLAGLSGQRECEQRVLRCRHLWWLCSAVADCQGHPRAISRNGHFFGDMMSITRAIPAILGVWGTRITRIFIEKNIMARAEMGWSHFWEHDQPLKLSCQFSVLIVKNWKITKVISESEHKLQHPAGLVVNIFIMLHVRWFPQFCSWISSANHPHLDQNSPSQPGFKARSTTRGPSGSHL